MTLFHENPVFFETVKSKVIISLFETVRLSVSISPRNLYNSLTSKKEKAMYFAFYKWLNYFFITDQTFSDFLARTISVFLHSVTKCHSVRFSLAAYLRNAKTVSSDQSAQKKCKTNSGSDSRVFQPQWLMQFDWLEYDVETKRLFCRT